MGPLVDAILPEMGPLVDASLPEKGLDSGNGPEYACRLANLLSNPLCEGAGNWVEVETDVDVLSLPKPLS
ncbi:hypothetical protein Hanom_Chr14g01310461 [Helianthus anomalus]